MVSSAIATFVDPSLILRSPDLTILEASTEAVSHTQPPSSGEYQPERSLRLESPCLAGWDASLPSQLTVTPSVIPQTPSNCKRPFSFMPYRIDYLPTVNSPARLLGVYPECSIYTYVLPSMPLSLITLATPGSPLPTAERAPVAPAQDRAG